MHVPSLNVLDVVICFVVIWQDFKHFLTCCVPFSTEAFKAMLILHLK